MIILVFLKKIFAGMGSPAPLFQHVWKFDHFLTLNYDYASFNHFQKLFCVNFWLAMLLLIFKSLFGVVVWKCQIVKIWSFLEEHGTVTVFCFFICFNQMIIFNDTTICIILPNMWQHFAKYVSFNWTCPFVLNIIPIIKMQKDQNILKHMLFF